MLEIRDIDLFYTIRIYTHFSTSVKSILNIDCVELPILPVFSLSSHSPPTEAVQGMILFFGSSPSLEDREDVRERRGAVDAAAAEKRRVVNGW